jgi:hypothetical protein
MGGGGKRQTRANVGSIKFWLLIIIIVTLSQRLTVNNARVLACESDFASAELLCTFEKVHTRGVGNKTSGINPPETSHQDPEHSLDHHHHSVHCSDGNCHPVLVSGMMAEPTNE